jgi:hypothetical protein
MYDMTGSCSGMATIPDDTNSVDPDVAYAGGELVRILKSGVISNGLRVEKDDIGVIAWPQETTIV